MSNEHTPSALSLEVREDGVGILWIDVPGQSQNTLIEGLREDFESKLRAVRADDKIHAVVVASKKPASFMAGADIKMIQTIKSAEDAERRSRLGQAAFDELESSEKPRHRATWTTMSRMAQR